jgi:hypothetical protein
MPALFSLPKVVPLSSAGGLLPGAKLHFFQTGTSTPQNTYQDVALTTAHANPVIADAEGVFAPIYLDPSLPAYRVRLSTSADVQLWQLDNIPSNQNTAQQFRLKHTTPKLLFEETDASSNNKIWSLKVDGEQFILSILNDAESVETTVFTFDRSGTTVDQLNFAGQYLRVGGNLVLTQDSGSFTATLTGMSSATTGTVGWHRSGTVIALRITSQIAGTSNSTAMSMTGVPSGLLSATGGHYKPCIVRDNGASVLGSANVTDSSILFNVAAATAFTGSGSKGLPAGWELIYDTDQSGIA